ncbi:histidine phosphatase family protein [Bacillus sp. AFS015802]|uniref:histidine phosphatase family protein n=1 Tax=Bacillus sp. AFS015802 TaxID=2033486 RepID=UPI00211D6CEF|nr:histidine phosphatase family protein [Bacillus sp. AFS015802]
MVIGFIRHGLTEENERGKYIGWTNPSLSKGGIDILQRRRPFFRQYEGCFSSDLNRCVESSHFLFPGVPIKSSPLLRELHFGKWEGLTFETLKGDGVYQDWLTNPTISPPGGEGMNAFRKRVDVAWEQIKAQIDELNGKRYAVITHGGVIRHLLTSLSPGNDPRTFWEWKVSHGTGYELIWETEEDWRDQVCTSLRAVPLTGRQDG